MITEFPTRVNVTILSGEILCNVEETQEVLLYSSVNGSLHILQYSYSITTSLATVCFCVDFINFTAVDGWQKCTEGMAVATELYRNGATVALSAVQYSDRLLFYFSP